MEKFLLSKEDLATHLKLVLRHTSDAQFTEMHNLVNKVIWKQLVSIRIVFDYGRVRICLNEQQVMTLRFSNNIAKGASGTVGRNRAILDAIEKYIESQKWTISFNKVGTGLSMCVGA